MSISQKGILASERGDAAACSPPLRKELNLFYAVAIVVGTIIGSGIFLIPSSIAARLNSSVPCCSYGWLEESSHYAEPCHWLNSAQFSLALAACALICGILTVRCQRSYMPGKIEPS